MAAEENMCNDETQISPNSADDVQVANIFTVEGKIWWNDKMTEAVKLQIIFIYSLRISLYLFNLQTSV